MITTGDHDDRVVPAHSFKFAATLQAAQAGPNPVLIRIETNAGHGAGKATTKAIEERADMYAFLVKNLRLEASPVTPLYFNTKIWLMSPRVRGWWEDGLWGRCYQAMGIEAR